MSLEQGSVSVRCRLLPGGRYALILEPSGVMVAEVSSQWGSRHCRRGAAQDVERVINEYWLSGRSHTAYEPGRFAPFVSEVEWRVDDLRTRQQFIIFQKQYATPCVRHSLAVKFASLLNTFYEGP